jgi:hypothetical protein
METKMNWNEDFEQGYRIDKKSLKIISLSEGTKNQVHGLSYKEERELSQTSWSIHTHPEIEVNKNSPSGLDIVACAVRGIEVIQGRDNYLIMTSLCNLSTSDIEQISEESWDKAELNPWVKDEGCDPYWYWKEIIVKELPYKIEIFSGQFIGIK